MPYNKRTPDTFREAEMSGNGGDLNRGERLQIMLAPEELEALDNFRFKQRMPSRAAAVRELLRLGLASVGIKPAGPGIKSGSFGVLGPGNAPAQDRD